MRDLIDRLEKATGPSVSLNRAIWCALNPGQDASTYNGDPRWKPYTASIDAALQCGEHGWEYQISTLYGIADVEAPLNDVRCAPTSVRRKDGNVPLALCTAFLSARIDIAEYEAAISSGERA